MKLGQIDEKHIRAIADSNSILMNGRLYFQQGRIKYFKVKENKKFNSISTLQVLIR